MVHGLLLDCPPEVVNSWWTIIADAGLTVDITPPLSTDVPAEPDGFHYRGGSIRKGKACVEIWACPGPRPSSASPLRGKHFLVINFKQSCSSSVELADLICSLMETHGAVKLADPGEIKSRTTN